jgi:hypothetical protein
VNQFSPIVMMDRQSVPFLVFARGRKNYHAIKADTMIRIASIETLRGLAPVLRKGEPYPPRRAASYWLNHDHRTITGRAMRVLRGLVSRKKRGARNAPLP